MEIISHLGRKQHMALLSVVVSVYNSEQYIQKCIESVLGQTFHDLECIIVDDGSYDQSYSICKKFLKDSRVSLIHQENMGSVAARNKGVNLASGEIYQYHRQRRLAGP